MSRTGTDEQRAVVIAMLVVQQGVCSPKDAVARALDLLELPGEMLLPCLLRLDSQRHGCTGETTQSLVVGAIWDWICGEPMGVGGHWLANIGRRLAMSEVARDARGESWSRDRAEEIYEAWLHGLPSVCAGIYKEAA